VTFSITALCPESGAFGMAISSSSPAVAARCAHLRAGIGAVASQNITDPRLGQQGLSLLGKGHSADQVVAALRQDALIRFRQIAVVDRAGLAAGFSGDATLGCHAMAFGKGAVAAGNLLAQPSVPAAMIQAFKAAEGPLAERLMQALEQGLAAGGEAGPVYSAGLIVVRDLSWPLVELRIDWHETPIAQLRQAWNVYAPQVEDYVRRAFQPEQAPSYGVPGDA
jgi:uncharacterized Ntn-hydrolase superfamily protein